MEKFLKTYFPEAHNLKIKKLDGDGGHRSYHRIWDKDKTYILMESGENDPSLKNFIFWQKKLEKAKAPVPKLFKWDLEKGKLLLEDLGNHSLEKAFVKKEGRLKLYFKTLENLISIQETLLPTNQSLRFDSSFLIQETQTALKRFQLFFQKNSSSIPDSSSFEEEMAIICKSLDKLPFAFCHRDYHSRNLMIKEEDIFIIDFQDAGSAPFCYDLTSLLYDSYITLSLEEKKELIDFYFNKLPSALKKSVGNAEEIHHFTKLLFLQRGFKACGCFVGFSNDSNKKSHLPFVKPTLLELESIAKSLFYEKTALFFKQLSQRLPL